jgi:hypothetical protein
MLGQGRHPVEEGQAGRVEREHIEAVDQGRDAKQADHPAEPPPIGQADGLEFPDDGLELAPTGHQLIERAIESR